MSRPGSKFRFFADKSREAWGFGLMVPHIDRYALIVIGPFSFGVEW